MLTLGICFGSFINALVWRLHEQAASTKKRHDPKLSISQGRSMCVHCGHELAAKDLIPLLSWLSLKGKCRYCHKPISWQYPLVELLTALMFGLSYIFWPLSFGVAGSILFALWLAILVMVVALAAYDIKWMILPDRIVFPLIVVSAVFATLRLFYLEPFSVGNLLLLSTSVAVAGGIFYTLYVVSDGQWIGGGDAKLGVSLGLILARPENSLMMIFLASLIGSLIALPLLSRGKNTKLKLPFGPLLIMAMIIVFWWNDQIIHWYNSLLLT
jgi:prepilin signal peptidase PulO-like enzyme (type II secretory pathway)